MKTLNHPRGKNIFSSIFHTLVALFLVVGLSACAEREAAEVDVETETPAVEEGTGQAFEQTSDFGTFNEWDADANAEINESEWDEGWTDTNLFSEWDTNADDNLTQEEWTAGTEEWTNTNWDWGLFEDWDADANAELTQDEFGAGLYTAWDANDDDALTQEEFTAGTEAMPANNGGGGIGGATQGGLEENQNENM